MTTLTKEMVEHVMPPNLKGAVTQTFVDTLNNIAADPLLAEQIRNNFVSYTAVLKEGKFKTEDYLNAVVYVSHKLMGANNQDAYAKTFPQRYQTLLAKGTSSKDIAAYVSAYNKGKLVNLVLEQTMVPSYVLNAHLYQDALNHQHWLMKNAHSEKVQTEAANSLLTALKVPEAVKSKLEVEIKDTSGLNELKNALRDLAQSQIQHIDNGASVADIAGSKLIEAEATEIGPDQAQP